MSSASRNDQLVLSANEKVAIQTLANNLSLTIKVENRFRTLPTSFFVGIVTISVVFKLK